MGKVVMYSTVSVDGFIADENDQVGPLFDWMSSGDVALDETGGIKVSQASYDCTRPYGDEIGVVDRRTATAGRPPRGDPRQPGPPPALPGAPITALTAYVKRLALLQS
jgi:hypothetical protein